MKKYFIIFLLVFPCLSYSQNFWECSSNNGFASASAGAITFYKSENIILIASQFGIYKSTNDGESWIVWSNGIIPDVSHISKNDSDVTFAATYFGIYRTTNIGTTWDIINNGFQNLEFIRVFVKNGIVFAGNLFGEIYKSTDLGDSWFLVKQTPINTYSLGYAADEEYTYLGIEAVKSDSGGVLRSSDSGETWELINNGFAVPSVHTLAINNNGDIFAGSNDGIYYSSNNGNLWHNINNGLYPYMGINCINVFSNGDVYVGCEGNDGFFAGAYRSTNNGGSWELINSGLRASLIYFIDISPSGYLFSGTFDNPTICGIYKSLNPILNIKNEKVFSREFSLSQNYPNPFNPSTVISWQSPESSWQTLKVYDILGNEVATLVDEYKPSGNYEVEFNTLETLHAKSLPSGVYFYQLKAGDFMETKKMILIR